MRLIDADAIFEAMENAEWYNNADRDEVAEVLVMNAPTIEPEQAVKDCRNCKHGKYNDHFDTYFCYCAEECDSWDKWEPSAQPEQTCEYWDRESKFCALHRPDAQPEPSEIARDIADIIENEMDMRVIRQNAQPERTGRWIDAVLPNDNGGLPVQVCDQCNTFFPLAYTGGGHHFCPNCGCRMMGVEHERNN